MQLTEAFFDFSAKKKEKARITNRAFLLRCNLVLGETIQNPNTINKRGGFVFRGDTKRNTCVIIAD